MATCSGNPLAGCRTYGGLLYAVYMPRSSLAILSALFLLNTHTLMVSPHSELVEERTMKATCLVLRQAQDEAGRCVGSRSSLFLRSFLLPSWEKVALSAG